MHVHPTVAFYGLTAAGGLLFAQLPPEGLSLGQGAGTGAFLGSVIAMAITAFGTSVWPKPFLDARGDRKRREELEAHVKTNTGKVDELLARDATRDKEIRAERDGFLGRIADLTARLGGITEENVRLIHLHLVNSQHTRPGDPSGLLRVLIDDAMPIVPATTVLLIEDEPGPREALKQWLSRFGFEVDAVGTLAEGLDGLDRHPDYAVLDLKLPDGDGLDLLRKVRDEGRTTSVVIVTGLADSRILGLARALKPSALIAKPFDLHADLLPALGWSARR